MTIVVDSPARLADAVGQSATSEWFPIDQERIAAFADATDDWQWIHLDAAARGIRPLRHDHRARLPHAVAAPLASPGLLEVGGTAMVVNYGLDRVRFLQPVPAGSRVRAVTEIAAVEQSGQGYRVSLHTTVELEGSERPALVADTVGLFVPER